MEHDNYILNNREIDIYTRTLKRAITRKAMFAGKILTKEDLEDLIQDGLLRLVKRVQQGIRHPYWLFKYSRAIGVNLAANYIRNLRRRKKTLDIDSIEIPVSPICLSEINEMLNMKLEAAAEEFGVSKSELHRVLRDVG